MINLGMLAKLAKFRHLTTHTIEVDHLVEVGKMFGKDLPRDLAGTLLKTFQKDEVEPMADWIMQEENLAKLHQLLTPRQNGVMIACPNCGELSTYQIGTIPQVEPHVVCRWCQTNIQIDPNA